MEECCTETMILRNKQKNIEAWKCNPEVVIYDSDSSDILADLLQIDIETLPQTMAKILLGDVMPVM